MKLHIRLRPWLAAAAFLVGCDATVGLDPTRPTFTGVLVPGACKRQDNLQMVELSVMLLYREDAILPSDKLRREIQPVSDILKIDHFVFQRPQTEEIGDIEEPAFARAESSDSVQGVGLRVEDLQFSWSGGPEGREKDNLVVLLLDHSGSLIGEDPLTQLVDTTKASDRNRQRVTFFQAVLEALPSDDWVSLVSFNGNFPNITPEFSTPTRNRDVTLDGLSNLGRDERGSTPLADALDQTLTRIIDAASNSDLNPVVILFTDGVENGDVSTANLAEVTQRYATHQPAPVPIIVMQLQPPPAANLPRGRDRGLVDLACQTGGEFLFLERADELTASKDLQNIVVNRIVGIWRLGVQTTLGAAPFPVDNYFLSTELLVTLGGKTDSAPLVKSRDASDDFNDTRLWFYK